MMDKNEEKKCRGRFEKAWKKRDRHQLFPMDRDEEGKYIVWICRTTWQGFRDGWEAYKKMSE